MSVDIHVFRFTKPGFRPAWDMVEEMVEALLRYRSIYRDGASFPDLEHRTLGYGTLPLIAGAWECHADVYLLHNFTCDGSTMIFRVYVEDMRPVSDADGETHEEPEEIEAQYAIEYPIGYLSFLNDELVLQLGDHQGDRAAWDSTLTADERASLEQGDNGVFYGVVLRPDPTPVAS